MKGAAALLHDPAARVSDYWKGREPSSQTGCSEQCSETPRSKTRARPVKPDMKHMMAQICNLCDVGSNSSFIRIEFDENVLEYRRKIKSVYTKLCCFFPKQNSQCLTDSGKGCVAKHSSRISRFSRSGGCPGQSGLTMSIRMSISPQMPKTPSSATSQTMTPPVHHEGRF